jgi:hypothetical protein
MKQQRSTIQFALGIGGAIAIPGIVLGTAGTALTQTAPAPTPVVRSSGIPIFENITLTPNFTPDPAQVRGISGGEIPAEEITGRPETATGACAGFIDTEPDHRMTLTSAFQFLSLRVQSAEDTTLVVRGPGGIWCNDNYTDWNPGIVGQWLSGTYDIWIGSTDPGIYSPYVLRFSETEED